MISFIKNFLPILTTKPTFCIYQKSVKKFISSFVFQLPEEQLEIGCFIQFQRCANFFQSIFVTYFSIFVHRMDSLNHLLHKKGISSVYFRFQKRMLIKLEDIFFVIKFFFQFGAMNVNDIMNLKYFHLSKYFEEILE